MSDAGKCEEIGALARAGETVTVELKSKQVLTERTSRAGLTLASEIVAMTNRRGGRILIGVDNASKQIEPDVIVDHDAVAQWISRICQDRCSPPILVEHEFVGCTGGEVLVLKVPRRAGAPHAAISRMEGGVSGRAYYIRTNEGKQLVTEAQLNHLFQSAEFPDIEKRFVLGYLYHRPGRRRANGLPAVPPERGSGASSIPSVEKAIEQIESGRELFPEPPAMFHVQALLQACSFEGLPGGDSEADVVLGMLRDAFPYAVFNYLSWRSDLGWATESNYSFGMVSTKLRDTPSITVRPEDLPAPSPDSILARACPSFAKNFSQFGIGGAGGGVRLPPGTEVRIQPASEGRGDSSLLSLTSTSRFSLQVETRAGPWNVGIPLGHPLRRAIGAYILDANDPRGTAFASVQLKGSTDVGGPAGDEDYYAWLARLVEGIRQGFDYNIAQASLPDHHTLRIEMMTKEILARLQALVPPPKRPSEG